MHMPKQCQIGYGGSTLMSQNYEDFLLKTNIILRIGTYSEKLENGKI